MRAGLYLRISRDIAGQGLGVQRQEEDCRKLTDELGWEVAGVYVDNDVSATSGKARPSYKRLLADIEAGLITAVVVWSPDRLYRRAADLEQLIPVLEAHNVQVRTVKAGDLDLSTAYGRMIARILGAIATGEGEVKSERWKRSWRQGREAGTPVTMSHRLFGYARDGETIVPAEAAVTRHLAAELLNGKSQMSMLRWLEEQGVTTTRGGPWSQQGLKRYLTNPRLAGYSTLKGEIVAEGQWEPILDRDAWEELRALLTSRAHGRPTIRRYLLTGLLICGGTRDDGTPCASKMIAGQVTAANQKKSRYYRCPPLTGCGKVGGMAEPIEEIVEGYAAERLADPAVVARIDALRAEPSGAQHELAALELRIRELEAQLDEPGTPVATILRAIDRARARQEELVTAAAARPRAAIPTGGAPWPADLLHRRALVDLVVARVDLAPRLAPTNRFNPDRVRITER